MKKGTKRIVWIFSAFVLLLAFLAYSFFSMKEGQQGNSDPACTASPDLVKECEAVGPDKCLNDEYSGKCYWYSENGVEKCGAVKNCST